MLIAVNIAAFEDLPTFKRRVDEIVRQIESSAKADDDAELFAPGGLEEKTSNEYQQLGILLSGETVEGLLGAARSLDLSMTLELL